MEIYRFALFEPSSFRRVGPRRSTSSPKRSTRGVVRKLFHGKGFARCNELGTRDARRASARLRLSTAGDRREPRARPRRALAEQHGVGFCIEAKTGL